MGDWRLWSQAETDLSSETRAFIEGLDPLAAASLSAELGLPDGVWRTVAVMTLLIQACLGGGKMTLRQVAELTMNRWSDATKDTEVSFVEKLGTDLVAADHLPKLYSRRSGLGLATPGSPLSWSVADWPLRVGGSLQQLPRSTDSVYLRLEGMPMILPVMRSIDSATKWRTATT